MSRDWLNLTWRQKTWSERGQTVFANILATAFTLAMAFGALYVLGQIIDTQDQRRTEQRRCLQGAVTPQEYAECR